MKSKSITVLLVDDHAVVREGYRSFLEKQNGMNVIAEAADGEEAHLL
jgi:DNA-binding NarL/FixJ family response regulator